MIYPIIKIPNSKFKIQNSREAGVTLLLSILVLSAVMAIAFSLATILLVEVRVAGDLLRTEPAIYSANAVTEEALFVVSRNYPRCADQSCSGMFRYTTQIGAVNLNSPQPTENQFHDAKLQDTVLATSNSITNTKNRYSLYNPNDINVAGGYDEVEVTYKDSDVGGQIHIYVCEFKAPEDFAQDDPPVDCQSATSTNMIYSDVTLNEGITSSRLDLNPNMQQELIIYSTGYTVADRFIQIRAFGTGQVPKGIPYYGETVLDINASYGGVTRAVRVKIPNTGSSSSGGGSSNVASVDLDGNGDYLSVPNQASLSLNNFTVEAWVYPRSMDSDWQPIIAKEDGSGESRNYGMYIIPNTMRVHYSFQGPCGSFRSYNSIGSLNEDQWSHVAMTYNGSQFIFYINGVQDSLQNISATPCASSNPVKIGGEVNVYSDLDGLVDEVRIWNTALSGAVIASNRSVELTGNEAGLVGYWKFNENSGSSASNSVTGGNAASFLGNSTWSVNKPF